MGDMADMINDDSPSDDCVERHDDAREIGMVGAEYLVPRTDPWVTLAQGKDKTRPTLFGVWLERGRQFATDGHRLHVLPDPTLTAPLPVLVTPTGTDVSEFGPLAPPEIDNMIPQGKGVSIDGKALRKAIRAAVKAYDRDGHRKPIVAFEPVHNALVVRAMVAGKPILSSKDGSIPKKRADRIYGADVLGDQTGDLAAYGLKRYPNSKTDTSLPDHVGFNGLYLLDALGSRPGEIKWFHADLMCPLKITHADGRIAVVMPVRR